MTERRKPVIVSAKDRQVRPLTQGPTEVWRCPCDGNDFRFIQRCGRARVMATIFVSLVYDQFGLFGEREFSDRK